MKAQGERVQVAERFNGNASYRLLRNSRKQHFAQFGEQRVGKTQRAIEPQQQHWQSQWQVAAIQLIDDALEYQWHADIGNFRGNQAG